MEDLRHQVETLRRRQRLQNILSIGVLVILMFAMGGADTVARTLVESDAWKVRTKNLAGTQLLDRITVTSDVDRSKLKVLNGNIQLEGQTSLPALVAADEGTLGFDSTAKKLKYWNGTAWVDSSGGGGGGGGGLSGVAGRLEIAAPTGTNTLYLKQYCGESVDVDGESVQIESAGKNLTTTSLLIGSDGLDISGSGMQANQDYFIYLSNSQVAQNPSKIRASTVGPAAQLYKGAKYLGTSGTPSKWRFLGWVRTTASNTFQDDQSKRFVINYYNRRALKLAVTTTFSGYVTYNTPSWNKWFDPAVTQQPGGQDVKVEFISNGEDLVFLNFGCCSSVWQGGWSATGIGLDTYTSNSASTTPASYGYYYGYNTAIYNSVPAAGHRTLWMLWYGNGTYTYWYGLNTSTPAAPGAAGYVMG